MFDFSKLNFSKNDLLVVIDAQVDFMTGILSNEHTKKIIPDIAKLIEIFPGQKVFTKDTHLSNYLDTREGKYLPVIHTELGAPGWQLVPEIQEHVTTADLIIAKNTFGSVDLSQHIHNHHYPNIYFVGVDTGYCVISNVIMANSADPETNIHVIEPLCACATKESHETAIKAMENMFIDIIRG